MRRLNKNRYKRIREEISRTRRRLTRDNGVEELDSQYAGRMLAMAQRDEKEGDLYHAAGEYYEAATAFGRIGEDREAARYYSKAHKLSLASHYPLPHYPDERPSNRAKHHRERAAVRKLGGRRMAFSFAAGLFILVGLSFLSFHITGNAIGSALGGGPDFFGTLFFVIGLTFLFLVFKN